jgi:hypothetical protein
MANLQKEDSVLFNSYVAAPEDGEGAHELAQRMTSWTRQGCGVGANVSSLLHASPDGKTAGLGEVVEIIGLSQQTLWDEGIRRTATMLNVDFGLPGINQASRAIANIASLRHLNIAVMVSDATLRLAIRAEPSPEKAEMEELAKTIWECGNPGFVFVRSSQQRSRHNRRDSQRL